MAEIKTDYIEKCLSSLELACQHLQSPKNLSTKCITLKGRDRFKGEIHPIKSKLSHIRRNQKLCPFYLTIRKDSGF